MARARAQLNSDPEIIKNVVHRFMIQHFLRLADVTPPLSTVCDENFGPEEKNLLVQRTIIPCNNGAGTWNYDGKYVQSQ